MDRYCEDITNFMLRLYRRIREYNLDHLSRFLDISDDELDALIRGYISRHGIATGESHLIGFIKSRKG